MAGDGFEDSPLRVLIPVIHRPAQAGGAQTFETSILLAVDRLGDHELKEAGIHFSYFARSPEAFHSFHSLGGRNSQRFVCIKPGRADPLLRLVKRGCMAARIKAIAKALARRQTTRLACALRDHCDIIWNLHPATLLDQLPYVVTVWDLQHRLQPFFPEVAQNGAWQLREDVLRNLLPPATAVVAGTSRLQQELQQFYGIDSTCVWINPLPTCFPQGLDPIQDINVSSIPPPTANPFILYPAQFWAHKNHRGLLVALKQLKARGLNLDLVLTGSDMGLQAVVRGWIDQLDLAERVHCLGFVPRDRLEALYVQCRMLCFPSFFGPDNIPPLEAMAFGVPVAAADVPGAREQLQDSALFFDPSSPHSIADAIQRLHHDTVLRNRLIQAGLALAAERTPDRYVQRMISAFQQLKPRLKACQPLL